MYVVKKRSMFMPTLNSYFISNYSEEFVNEVKSLRSLNLGGDKYIKQTSEWEVTEEIWKKVSHFPHTFTDLSMSKPIPLVLDIDPNDLYSYQDKAASILRDRKECLLFFDTGTGKTRTALLALSRLSSEFDSVIVVGEANLSKVWMTQVQGHFPDFAPRFKVINDVAAMSKRINMIQSAPKGTIFIINIQSVRNNGIIRALNFRNLAVCILDECQCIIGKTSQQTEGMHALQSEFRWALSATPIKNNPLEWHSLLAWLRVIKLDGSMTRFKQHYAYMEKNKFGNFVFERFRNQEDLEDLKNLVSVRVTKDRLGLPPRTDVSVEFNCPAVLRKIFRAINSEKSKVVINSEFIINGMIFKADNLSKLFYIERVSTILTPEKIDFILSHLDKPLIVVSCFKAPLEFIHSIIPDCSVLYHGDLSIENRQANLSAFIDGDKRVLLMTLKSGGVGLTLTTASTMVFLDAPVNQADFNQCADRIHRIGQQNAVTIYKLITKDTLDVYAWQHMSEKQGWIQRYFDINYEESL